MTFFLPKTFRVRLQWPRHDLLLQPIGLRRHRQRQRRRVRQLHAQHRGHALRVLQGRLLPGPGAPIQPPGNLQTWVLELLSGRGAATFVRVTYFRPTEIRQPRVQPLCDLRSHYKFCRGWMALTFLSTMPFSSIVRKSEAPRLEPRVAGWEARTQPLCYANPLHSNFLH